MKQRHMFFFSFAIFAAMAVSALGGYEFSQYQQKKHFVEFFKLGDKSNPHEVPLNEFFDYGKEDQKISGEKP